MRLLVTSSRLRTDKDRYKRLVEESLCGLYKASPEAGLIFANSAFLNMFGFDSLQEAQQSDLKELHPDTKLWTRQLRRQIKIPATEIECSRKGGETFWGLSRVVGEFDGRGELTEINGAVLDISACKQAELSLSRAQERYQQAVLGANLGVCCYDPETQRSVLSPGFMKQFGYDLQDPEESYNLYCSLVHDDDKSVVTAVMQAHLHEGKPYGLEYRVRTRSNELRWVRSWGQVSNGHAGLPEEVTAFIQDITPTKQTARVLQESEEKFRQLVENTGEVFWIVSPDWESVFYISPLYEEIWGRSTQSLLATPLSWIEAVHPDDRAPVAEQIKALGQGDHAASVLPEYRVVQPDGTERWVCARAFPIRNKTGEVVRIVGTAEDITERKEIEHALQKETERAQLYLDNAGEILLVINADGTVSLINSLGCKLLGRRETDIVGCDWFEQFIPESSRAGARIAFAKLVSGATRSVERTENPILTKGGQERVFVWHNRVLRDDDGKVTAALSSGVDVTGRKVAEAKLQRRLKMEEMVAGISRNLAGCGLKESDARVTSALQTLAQSTGAVRGSLFVFSENLNRVTNTHEWCSEQCDSQIPLLQDVPTETFGYYGKLLRNFEEVAIGSPDDLPADAVGERAWCEVHGFRPLLFVPMISANVLYGAVGFYGKVGEERHWSAEFSGLLTLVGNTLVNVLERLRSERYLTDSEKKYRSLFEHANDSVFVIDPASHAFLDANEKAHERLGYTRNELLQMTVADLSAPELSEKIPHNIQELKAKGGHVFEHLHRRKDGTNVPVEISARIVPFGGREIFLAFVRDISDRKKAEQRLEEGRERIRAIVDNVADALITINTRGLVQTYNPAAEKIFGYQSTEIIGGDVGVLMPARYRAKHSTYLQQAISSGPKKVFSFRREEEGRRKDGTVFPIRLAVSEVRMADSTLFIAIVRDITKERAAKEALQESERRHRTLFETMVQGVVYHDGDGRIISANPAAEAILGLALPQLMGRDSLDPHWQAIHEDGSHFPGETHPAMVALRTGKEVRNVLMGLFNSSEKKHRWVKVNAHPQLEPGQKTPFRVCTTFEDVTGLKEVEIELQSSLRHKKLLLKEIHHRVKNNLQVVSSLLNLQANSIDGITTKEALQESRARVQSMALLHEKLYQSQDLATVDFENYLNCLISASAASQVDTTRDISMSVDAKDITLDMDRSILCGLLVSELVSNSLKHAFKGRSRGKIAVTVTKDAGKQRHVLCVQDDGTGLPEQIHVEAASTLGLRLVAMFARQLGAELVIIRKSGTGFCVTF